MPGSVRRSGRPPHMSHSKQDEPQPYDDQEGAFSRKQLATMNDRFVERVEAAVRNGDEQPWWQRKRDLR